MCLKNSLQWTMSCCCPTELPSQRKLFSMLFNWWWIIYKLSSQIDLCFLQSLISEYYNSIFLVLAHSSLCFTRDSEIPYMNVRLTRTSAVDQGTRRYKIIEVDCLGLGNPVNRHVNTCVNPDLDNIQNNYYRGPDIVPLPSMRLFPRLHLLFISCMSSFLHNQSKASRPVRFAGKPFGWIS